VAQPSDVEEIAPDHYLIRNNRAVPFLRGEGDLHGQLFELRSWRRDGLIGRLRNAGLHVSPLEDQIDALPRLPSAPTLGEARWRALASTLERFSRFSLTHLRWDPIEPTERAGVAGVLLAPGEPLRRRKGRGAADYYVAAAERGDGARLLPCEETKALMLGYALATWVGVLEIPVDQRDDRLELPDLALPGPYQAIIERLAGPQREIAAAGRARVLAIAVYAKLR
jgi:hypothetical protein